VCRKASLATTCTEITCIQQILMQLIIRAGLRPTSKYQNISGTLALEKF
jgi:hypothetical protein